MRGTQVVLCSCAAVQLCSAHRPNSGDGYVMTALLHRGINLNSYPHSRVRVRRA